MIGGVVNPLLLLYHSQLATWINCGKICGGSCVLSISIWFTTAYLLFSLAASVFDQVTSELINYILFLKVFSFFHKNIVIMDELYFISERKIVEGFIRFVGFHHLSPKIIGLHGEGACLDGFWILFPSLSSHQNQVMSYWKQKQVLGIFELQKQSNGWQFRK